MDKSIPKNPIRFGIYASRPHKKWAFAAMFFVVSATLLDRYTIVILRNLTDSIAAQEISFKTVWFWALLYPVVSFMARGLWRGSGFTGMRWIMGLIATTYQMLFEYLTLHSKEYFNNRFAGSLMNKIGHAVNGTEGILEKILWKFGPLVIGLVGYVAIAWSADYRLGLIVAVWSVLFLSINLWFAKKLQPHASKFYKSLSTLKGRIVDSLSNISLVHEYAYVGGEREYIAKFVKKSHDIGLRQWQLFEWTLVINGFLVFIFTSTMVWTAMYLFQQQIISVGVIVMIIAIVAELSGQFLFVGAEIRDAAGAYGEAKEGLEEILDEHLIVDMPDARSITIENGNIQIDSISFEYENTKVFDNFSLDIQSGEKIGLVGRSGAGKTTFVSLLLRHYDVKKGIIKIDGHDISKITLESLRKAIAFVPQDTTLFHRSIRENISYSSTNASESDIIKAAKEAQANAFIQNLPKGYETLVGERGVKLSGGQRQRIAIARAFLKNAPILILDEATSSLDSQSELAIQESLEKLMKGRTVIAIAHRLSTLKKMDRIIVIENGKIAEDGKPDELLKRDNGKFRKMWDHQVKGFIVDE
jgi:ATP-binding cassette, subfamily B, bacterial